jgi:hypothetical protein
MLRYPAKKSKIPLVPGLCNPNQIVKVFHKTKSGHFLNVIFGVFFDVKGLC